MVHILGEGGEKDKSHIELATCKGRRIPNSRRWEMPLEARRASIEQWANLVPGAELRSLTATYNCMGMVFASRRTWVGPDQLELIKEDDGYEVVDEKKVVPGDFVLYRNAEGEVVHIGLLLEKQPVPSEGQFLFVVLSKWGQGGEYKHGLRDVPPILGKPAEFISERKVER